MRLAVALLVSFLVFVPLAKAQFSPMSREEAERMMISTTNDIGCVKTSIPWQVNGGPPGLTTFYFTRPESLDPENLTNKQLEECGFSARPTLRTQMRDKRAFHDWEELVRGELKAKQPTPWLPHVYTDPTWKRSEKRADRKDIGFSAASSSGYSVEPCNDTMCQTFAGRTIGDTNGQGAANPVTVSATIVIPPKFVFPASSTTTSNPRISYWVGYSGGYPSSEGTLAQGGVLDYLFTPAGGGSYKRHAPSLFVQFFPDVPAYLTDVVNVGDMIAVQVIYVNDTSANVKFFDKTLGIMDMMMVTLQDQSSCPPPPNGNGICNNGDVAEWMIEDHGDVSIMDYQDPPTTPNFNRILLNSPKAVYTNGDTNIPDNSNCFPVSATCPLILTQYNLVPPITQPSGFTVTPAWNATLGALQMVYPESAPTSGFNFH